MALLNEEIAALNIKKENLSGGGYLNIIVQSIGGYSRNGSEDFENNRVHTIYFQPRKEQIICEDIDLSSKEVKESYLADLRDSQERLKIMAELLHQQEIEIEKFGYPKTVCCYPEIESL